ncbi:TOBE domain-containing protein [Halomicroarcula sp. GCM10025817]|uniref:TOBE domain-containing protein n=1 Tax=Haloarcula TaxID=2237 RepID=UPI0023E8F184|nr:TOBE domain-containing protein [Halomicroarcula sp. SYNS111]
MDASVDAQLQAEGVAFTAADAALLRAIDRTGSVSGASEELGRSRARALDRIQRLEDAFGPLVDRHRGGETGGGSELTASAERLLSRFARLQAALASTTSAEESVLAGTVTEREGELGVVDTAAGHLRARLVDRRETVEVGAPVQVSVHSDAVTLHDPSDVPAASATSARNRFEGTVVDVERGTAVGRVTVDVGAESPLVALLTHESLDRMGLGAGDGVVASFKATATRALATG